MRPRDDGLPTPVRRSCSTTCASPAALDGGQAGCEGRGRAPALSGRGSRQAVPGRLHAAPGSKRAGTWSLETERFGMTQAEIRRLLQWMLPSSFRPRGRAGRARSRWTISSIEIGYPHTRGRHVRIVALLAPNGAADFMDSIPNAEATGWSPTVLELGTVASEMTVVRAADGTPCG